MCRSNLIWGQRPSANDPTIKRQRGTFDISLLAIKMLNTLLMFNTQINACMNAIVFQISKHLKGHSAPCVIHVTFLLKDHLGPSFSHVIFLLRGNSGPIPEHFIQFLDISSNFYKSTWALNHLSQLKDTWMKMSNYFFSSVFYGTELKVKIETREAVSIRQTRLYLLTRASRG